MIAKRREVEKVSLTCWHWAVASSRCSCSQRWLSFLPHHHIRANSLAQLEPMKIAECRLVLFLIGLICAQMAEAAGYFADQPSQSTAPSGSFQLLDQPPATLPPPSTGPVGAEQVAVPREWQSYTASTYQTAADCAVPTEHRLAESTWYTRIDYFHWNERFAGADFVNEGGPFFTLGYQRRSGRERFRGELFGSSVHYLADVLNSSNVLEPLSSHTNYLGVRGEYDLLFEPETFPHLSFFTGIGTRVWNRDLPDDSTASGTFVAGYQEFWWTVYPYLGMETRRDLHNGIELYSMERIGLTAITLERASMNDAALYPRPGITAQLEAGVRGKHVFVSAFTEVFRWQQSAESGGWLQPRSTLFTAGLRTGYSF
jgi:hypothetical protein